MARFLSCFMQDDSTATMRLLTTIFIVLSLIIGGCSASAQYQARPSTDMLDVKVSVVDAAGTPKPNTLVVLSVEAGDYGKWKHRQSATNMYGSTILSLEPDLFFQQKAVVAIMDQQGRQLHSSEARITRNGQRLRIELDH